jgi:hypothetical protein
MEAYAAGSPPLVPSKVPVPIWELEPPTGLSVGAWVGLSFGIALALLGLLIVCLFWPNRRGKAPNRPTDQESGQLMLETDEQTTPEEVVRLDLKIAALIALHPEMFLRDPVSYRCMGTNEGGSQCDELRYVDGKLSLQCGLCEKHCPGTPQCEHRGLIQATLVEKDISFSDYLDYIRWVKGQTSWRTWIPIDLSL